MSASEQIQTGSWPAREDRRRGAVATAAGSLQRSLARRSPWWLELAAIAWLCWIYDAITNFAPLRQGLAIGHAVDLLRFERVLHLDPELTLNRWLAGHHTLGLLLSDYYDNAHFVVTLSVLAWLWWRRPDIYRPLRSALVLTNVIAFVVFWRYPVAPPRMLGGFTDVVATTHAFGSWHTGVLASQANQLAAMPSLHMAWAVWAALAGWRLLGPRRGRWLVWLYPLLTTVAVLATGNHFLLDIVAGVATAALAVATVALLNRRWPAGLRRRASSRASAVR